MSSDGKLFLVRHGEAASTWGRHADPGLSELGERQAADAARALRTQLGDRVATLLSSPLRRARETAEPLAATLEQPVTINARFREIPSPVPLSQRHDWLTRFMGQQWSAQDEAILAWRDALLQGLDLLPADSVVFTHFLVLNTVVGHLRGQNDTLVFWPANASVTVLERRSGVLCISALGNEMASRVN